jgi:hypothetical protein
MTRRALGAVSVVGLVALAATAIAAASSSQVWVNATCTKEKYKPKEIVLACGDGASLLRQLSWSSWTTTGASGKGQNAVNDCKPACFKGHFHNFPVKVTLSKPVKCKGHRHKVFNWVKVRYTAKRPPGIKKSTFTQKLGCPV